MLLLILRRLLLAGVTLLGVTLVTFVVVYRIPADPAALLAGQSASPEVVANIRTRLKLDRPVLVQYAMVFGAIGVGLWMIIGGIVVEPPPGLMEAINRSNARIARLFGRPATA